MIETYYDAALWPGVHIAAYYQLFANPAYNRDRGPVSVLGARIHGAF